MSPHRYSTVLVAISLINIILGATIGVTKKGRSPPICPLGFSIAYTNDERPICYRLGNEKEAFEDLFKNCAGNLYTSELYHSLNITRTTHSLWSGHKSMYPGGPFVDWSFSPSIGQLLTNTYDVKYNPDLGLNEELCVVIDSINNFTAARCTDKYYRYCMVEPYDSESLTKCDELEELTEYYRFWSPRPTCLSPVIVKGLRANWKRAQDSCLKRGGSLLNRGWRYANHPLLHTNKTGWSDPLGIIMESEEDMRWVNKEDGIDEVPYSEWELSGDDFTPENSYVSLRNGMWYLVNSSHIFMDVICERSIHLRNVNMTITVDGSKLTLQISEYINESDISCFTDAILFSPVSVEVKRIDDYKFDLTTISDGIYWCVHRDSKNFNVAESNKVLYVQEKNVANLYAVTIKLRNKYRLENNMDRKSRYWKQKLKQYIYYTTKYLESGGVFNTTDHHEVQNILRKFKSSIDESDESKDDDVIKLLKIKKLFLDRETVLLHVHLNPRMKMVPPGFWEDVEVVNMKPAYFCSGTFAGHVKRVPLGQFVAASNCSKYTCVGDFNEGVQFVISHTEDCVASPVSTKVANMTVVMPTAVPSVPVTTTANHDDIESNRNGSTESDYIDTSCPDDVTETTTDPNEVIIVTSPYPNEVTTVNTVPEEVTTVQGPLPPLPTRPTTATPETSTYEPTSTTRPTTSTERPRPPEEQLQQVMQDLNSTLQNNSIPIFVETVTNYVDQVDHILEIEEELEFPGELLHLVDELAARADLNLSGTARVVRNNIAMLIGDATPDNPIKGLRIAAQDADSNFAADNFEIITEEINSTHLIANESEAVVHLPDSVMNSSRRISFVVFRNDRAFQSTDRQYAVNSRVLSIKVEDLTEFANGEVIDIHLRPMASEPARNQSRSCAYWQFLDDDAGSGYWSQEGCTFIPSSSSDQLDTCRCDHLTHFAEVLVPRTGFTGPNESALEIISIIGCVASIVGLILVGVTALLFRSWRRDFSNKIWLQLCIAIFILIICFLIVVFARFEQYDVFCLLVGVLLHYSTLASFCWMLVAAVLSYRRLVLVFTRDASHKLLRASAFSWGVPCAIVGVLLSANPHAYSGHFQEKSPSGSFCYPSGLGLWLSVYAPIAIMILANWTLFVLIVRSVFASRSIQRHGDSNEALRCASVSCLLVFLFGLPWLFGLFASNIVAAYLFAFMGSFQGFVLFAFFVLGNKKTRDLWLNKLKIKQTQKVPVTSSTYTNNKSQNSQSDWRGRSAPATIEANASKPRSLSSPDETRFS